MSMDANLKRTLANIREEYKKVGIESVIYSDNTITLGDVLSDLNVINTNHHHVFFDVSALQLPLYLITIYIDTDNNKVRITDLVSGKKYIGSYDANKTLYSCLQEAKDDIYTLSVNCYAPSGDSTDLTGIAVQVKDAQNNVIASGTYNGTTLNFPLPLNQTYKIEVLTQSLTISSITYFAPEVVSGSASGTLTANATVDYRYSSSQSINSLNAVKQFLALPDIDIATKRLALVRTETNSFSINITITNPENNTQYTMPCYVLDVEQKTKLVDGVEQTFVGARIGFAYQLPSDMVFDQREQLECDSGETFASGMYYFTATTSGVGDKTFTKLVEGTDYQVGDDIDTYKSQHSVYVFKNALGDTNAVRYGSNIYHYSNIHKWLNALGDNWFTPSYVGDILASGYSGKKGFLSWLDNDTLSLIEDDVAYGVYERSGQELPNNKLYAKVVLLSGTEVAGSVNANEGTVFEYWKYLNGDTISNSANANRTSSKITNTASKATFWLRSPYRGNSCDVWFVNYNGYVSSNGACSGYGVLVSFTV